MATEKKLTLTVNQLSLFNINSAFLFFGIRRKKLKKSLKKLLFLEIKLFHRFGCYTILVKTPHWDHQLHMRKNSSVGTILARIVVCC